MRYLRPVIEWKSCAALALEFAFCALVIVLTLQTFHPLTILLAWVVLGTRQHALFILYHDAVHTLIARNRRLNDLVINVFVGVPLLIPVHVYRAFHLSHHSTLATPHDTERILLYRWQFWNYRPLSLPKLILQMLGDLLLVNQILTSVALSWEKKNPDTLLRLPKTKATPETWILIVLFWIGMGIWAYLSFDTFWRVALLWFGAFLSFTQLFQKIRSFAEHGPLGTDDVTYSWRPGFLGRLILWPYNINYHREHHVKPQIPWHALPAFFPDTPGRRTSELFRLLVARRSDLSASEVIDT